MLPVMRAAALVLSVNGALAFAAPGELETGAVETTLTVTIYYPEENFNTTFLKAHPEEPLFRMASNVFCYAFNDNCNAEKLTQPWGATNVLIYPNVSVYDDTKIGPSTWTYTLVSGALGCAQTKGRRRRKTLLVFLFASFSIKSCSIIVTCINPLLPVRCSEESSQGRYPTPPQSSSMPLQMPWRFLRKTRSLRMEGTQ